MNIEELLRKHMDNNGVSVRELAEKSGASESTIRRILAGQGGNVRIETIVRLCSGLEIGLPEFFG